MKSFACLIVTVFAYQLISQSSSFRGSLSPNPDTTSLISTDLSSQIPTDCSFKKGYLERWQLDPSSPEKVYIVLNSHAISLFSDENVEDLICSVKLSDIYRPFASEEKCIVLQSSNSEDNLRLCSNNDQEKAIWQGSLEHFFVCSDKLDPEAQADLIGLEEEAKLEVLEHDELKKKAEEIIEKVKLAEDLEKENKKKMQQQLNDAKNELEKVKEQREALEKAMEAKAYEEMLLAENLIRKEKQKEEIAELEAAAQKIQEDKKKEAEELMEQQKHLIENKERETRDELSYMVSMAVEAGDKQFAHLCWQPELKGPNTDLMKSICLQKYGKEPERYEQELIDCPQPENFCKLCCSGFIGIEHLQDRKVCEYDNCGQLFSF
ncbi:unnamed protein product [Blepharisma stoltei]|uniref:PH domain-containing protein n=1 Tax=Blepharisma stoltei TaxID=1481888 RepID=A0AAU9KCD5_9CILI|nr:unnamed protein product [Blepharisma stoltei]